MFVTFAAKLPKGMYHPLCCFVVVILLVITIGGIWIFLRCRKKPSHQGVILQQPKQTAPDGISSLPAVVPTAPPLSTTPAPTALPLFTTPAPSAPPLSTTQARHVSNRPRFALGNLGQDFLQSQLEDALSSESITSSLQTLDCIGLGGDLSAGLENLEI